MRGILSLPRTPLSEGESSKLLWERYARALRGNNAEKLLLHSGGLHAPSPSSNTPFSWYNFFFFRFFFLIPGISNWYDLSRWIVYFRGLSVDLIEQSINYIIALWIESNFVLSETVWRKKAVCTVDVPPRLIINFFWYKNNWKTKKNWVPRCFILEGVPLFLLAGSRRTFERFAGEGRCHIEPRYNR